MLASFQFAFDYRRYTFMKRTLSVCLIGLTLLLAFSTSAFASHPGPNEPANESYLTAPTLSNPAFGQSGSFIQDYVSYMDLDYYKLFTQGTKQQAIQFIPPDNQVYFVAVYRYSDLLTGSASSIAYSSNRVTPGNPIEVYFYPEGASNTYVVSVGTSGGTGNENTMYFLSAFQYR